jgi:hypothetical protein
MLGSQDMLAIKTSLIHKQNLLNKIKDNSQNISRVKVSERCTVIRLWIYVSNINFEFLLTKEQRNPK